MKHNNGLITGRNQLQWVVLLLATAMALPTAALLWFMSRVVANERLAIKEKLASLYEDKLAEAAGKTEEGFAHQLAALEQMEFKGNPYSILKQLNLEKYKGMILLDSNWNLIYPVSKKEDVADDISADNPLAEARKLEFAKKKYEEAAQLYGRFTTDNNPQAAVAAIMGKSRCLSRADRLEEAIEECQKAAFFDIRENTNRALQFSIENARLLLLSLTGQSNEAQQNHSQTARRAVESLLKDVYNSEPNRALPAANRNLFVAKKVSEIIQAAPFYENKEARERLEKLIAAEEFSIAAAEDSSFMRTLPSRQTGVVFRKGEDYGFCHRTPAITFVIFTSRQGKASMLEAYKSIINGESIYRITDDTGNFVAGTENVEGKPFSVSSLPAQLPGWSVELYFGGSDVFEKAARRQIAVYTWTGFLVILFIFATGVFALKVVSRQIRLNKMKNDFIATVSHELKTPLASMRVLVDTLLEGNIKDEAQAEEYLRLTSKENERLSRMIDNFLTFSRMERNKKAFTIADARPAAIANDAIEAVKTKYATHNCRPTVEIAENLPDIQADHDAIVTVIVNLLDNACKYGGDNRQITLKVFSESQNVCFSVSDNGIGLARRHIRRIFDSFYQVDNSLARKAKGCGLGLSIVKFIVDAHKGKITVDSKLGKGSTFTVRIPVSQTQAG